MINAVIIIVIVIFLLFGVKDFLKRMASGCCGGNADIRQRKEANDRNRSHYPYEAVMQIRGMSCRNCAIKVENALNENAGIWARVNQAEGSADVLLKEKISDEKLAAPVCKAGYSVQGIKWKR